MDAESRPLVDTLCAQSTRLYGNFWGLLFSALHPAILFFLVMLRRPWCAYCFPVVCFHSQLRSAPEAGAPVAASPLGGALAFGISLGMQGLHPPWVLILKRGLERRRQRRGRVLGVKKTGSRCFRGAPTARTARWCSRFCHRCCRRVATNAFRR